MLQCPAASDVVDQAVLGEPQPGPVGHGEPRRHTILGPLYDTPSYACRACMMRCSASGACLQQPTVRQEL